MLRKIYLKQWLVMCQTSIGLRGLGHETHSTRTWEPRRKNGRSVDRGECPKSAGQNPNPT